MIPSDRFGFLRISPDVYLIVFNSKLKSLLVEMKARDVTVKVDRFSDKVRNLFVTLGHAKSGTHCFIIRESLSRKGSSDPFGCFG